MNFKPLSSFIDTSCHQELNSREEERTRNLAGPSAFRSAARTSTEGDRSYDSFTLGGSQSRMELPADTMVRRLSEPHPPRETIASQENYVDRLLSKPGGSYLAIALLESDIDARRRDRSLAGSVRALTLNEPDTQKRAMSLLESLPQLQSYFTEWEEATETKPYYKFLLQLFDNGWESIPGFDKGIFFETIRSPGVRNQCEAALAAHAHDNQDLFELDLIWGHALAQNCYFEAASCDWAPIRLSTGLTSPVEFHRKPNRPAYEGEVHISRNFVKLLTPREQFFLLMPMAQMICKLEQWPQPLPFEQGGPAFKLKQSLFEPARCEANAVHLPPSLEWSEEHSYWNDVWWGFGDNEVSRVKTNWVRLLLAHPPARLQISV